MNSILDDAHRSRLGRIIVLMISLTVAGVAIWMVSLAGPGSAPVAAESAGEGLRRLRVEVLEEYPHDPQAYTQGLLWYDGHLYESTGQYGRSSLRQVERDSGKVLATQKLPDEVFGEGLARVDDRLIQLTWWGEEAFVWERESFEPIGRLPYSGEGWGLCFDGRQLVMSDGSSKLTFRDPATFEVKRQVVVSMGEGAVGRLNELECVADRIYANVYTTDWIVRIDPESGRVEALIDASGLLAPAEKSRVDVLNGIAWDPDREVFYLTGKLWPRVFAVRFVDQTGS